MHPPEQEVQTVFDQSAVIFLQLVLTDFVDGQRIYCECIPLYTRPHERFSLQGIQRSGFAEPVRCHRGFVDVVTRARHEIDGIGFLLATSVAPVGQGGPSDRKTLLRCPDRRAQFPRVPGIFEFEDSAARIVSCKAINLGRPSRSRQEGANQQQESEGIGQSVSHAQYYRTPPDLSAIPVHKAEIFHALKKRTE